jgi:HAD superfamily hydrolase (TIGR01509 family)
MAVFTGASSQAAHMLLKETGLLEHFGVVVAGDQVDRQKPHPDGVLRACERLGVPAQAAAYVADAPIDLEAARRAGALPIAAGWVTCTRRTLRLGWSCCDRASCSGC